MFEQPVKSNGYSSIQFPLKEFYLSFLGIESFVFRNIRNFLRVVFSNFSSSESYFLKYSFISRNIRNFLILELESSMSWNIRNFFEVSISQNIRNLLILEQENSISRIIRNFFRRGFFFIFSGLGLKVR